MSVPRSPHASREADLNARARERALLLKAAARRTVRLRWTPRLLAALLDELRVDDDYFALLGGPKIPRARYPQAVALALLMRHAWRADDFADTASRLGLLGRRRRAWPRQQRRRGQRAQPATGGEVGAQ